MAYPTNAQIDEAVPVAGTPNRAKTNAALKAIVGAASYTPEDGTVPTRSVANENFSGGRLKAAAASDPDDCVVLAQLQALQASAQADSSATDVAGLVSDFNALLGKLRASGLLAS